MSTELDTRMAEHYITEFWGGSERGVCLQVTRNDRLFIQLTMEEAAALCNDLGAFIKREATRRQGLLRDQLKELQLDVQTVFHEVAELPSDLMAGPELAVSMVSRFCPKRQSNRLSRRRR